MALKDLTDEARAIVAECLAAAVDGPFFPDWEFQTLFGLTRDEVGHVRSEWPDVTNPDDAFIAVNNSLNNLIGYPHGCDGEWSDWISVSHDKLLAVLATVRGDFPRGYFSAME